jgi:hypothetical protein
LLSGHTQTLRAKITQHTHPHRRVGSTPHSHTTSKWT